MMATASVEIFGLQRHQAAFWWTRFVLPRRICWGWVGTSGEAAAPGSSRDREAVTVTSLGLPPTLVCSHTRSAASCLRKQGGFAYGREMNTICLFIHSQWLPSTRMTCPGLFLQRGDQEGGPEPRSSIIRCTKYYMHSKDLSPQRLTRSYERINTPIFLIT
jgi:hypothetical protein